MQAILPTNPLNETAPEGWRDGRCRSAGPSAAPPCHSCRRTAYPCGTESTRIPCIQCIFHITWLQMQAIDILRAQFKKQQVVSTLVKTPEKEWALPSNGIWKSHFDYIRVSCYADLCLRYFILVLDLCHYPLDYSLNSISTHHSLSSEFASISV